MALRLAVHWGRTSKWLGSHRCPSKEYQHHSIAWRPTRTNCCLGLPDLMSRICSRVGGLKHGSCRSMRVCLDRLCLIHSRSAFAAFPSHSTAGTTNTSQKKKTIKNTKVFFTANGSNKNHQNRFAKRNQTYHCDRMQNSYTKNDSTLFRNNRQQGTRQPHKTTSRTKTTRKFRLKGSSTAEGRFWYSAMKACLRLSAAARAEPVPTTSPWTLGRCVLPTGQHGQKPDPNNETNAHKTGMVNVCEERT